MSTELAKPADVGEYAIIKRGAKALEVLRENIGNKALSPADLARVSIPGSGGTSWSVPTIDGEKNEQFVEGVIVAFFDGRLFWLASYEETGGSAPPDCYSADTIVGHGDPGGVCADCPHDEWGSSPKGKGKACKERRMLYIVRKDSFMPLLISLPPTSLKACRNYFMGLAGAGIKFHQVVSRLTLSKTKNSDGIPYSEVSFQRVGALTPEQGETFQNFKMMITGEVAGTPEQPEPAAENQQQG